MTKKERIILSIKQQAIKRAKEQGEDYVVWQSTRKETLFFTAHKDTKIKDAIRVWPDAEQEQA